MSKKKEVKKISTSSPASEDIWQVYFLQLVLSTTVLRMIFAIFAELKYEEAYYWCYAQNLSLSYFDHPPMVGWLIYAFTQLGRDTELMVRVPAILLFTGNIALIFRLATKMFNSKVGFITSAVACCLPAFEWYGMFMLPDAPLIFFWTLGTYYGYRLVSENDSRCWWMIGLATGLGLLSKYPSLLIPLAPILYLGLEKRWKTIFNRHFCGAIVLAILLFSPVIIWNYYHEWCSFLFQGVSRFNESKSILDRFGGSILNQILILSPGGFFLTIWALSVSWKRRQEEQIRYLLCASLPFLAIMLSVSGLRLVQMNWPLPAYVTGIIIIGSELERRSLFSRKKILMGLVLIPALLISFLPVIDLAFPIAALNRANDIRGWRDLYKAVGQDLARMPDPSHTFIIGNNYQLSSELAFYTRKPELVMSANAWGVHSKGYNYWESPNIFKGWDAIIVNYEELRSNGKWKPRTAFYEESAKKHFEEFIKGDTLTIFNAGKPLRRYKFYIGHNYLGTNTSDSDLPNSNIISNP